MALLKLVDDLSRVLDDGGYAVGIFIDLAKAFDTVNHKILLKKLHFYGVRGTALAWFESYLSNRQQYVKIGIEKSNSSFSQMRSTAGFNTWANVIPHLHK